ncbi:hypothetical protein D8682_26405 [Buttiauxella sp. 3AFRM03]|nr:hypothetical protein D8682_01135 [Buttiauxella sp. 3AFRM03]AYN30200.1 hypothetical protein D8682_26405 [Buttiauxella sp. 3AFRM03]
MADNKDVTALPKNLLLSVDGYLDLTGTQITALPNNLICSSLYLDPERVSNVTFRKNCGNNNRTIFAVWIGETFYIIGAVCYIAAGSFYGPLWKFEDAVDLKYSGEAAEAYKQAGRDCIDELIEKLNTRPR